MYTHTYTYTHKYVYITPAYDYNIFLIKVFFRGRINFSSIQFATTGWNLFYFSLGENEQIF